MNLLRTLSTVALLAVVGTSTSSCLKAPDYPVTPTIAFSGLTSTYTPKAGGAAASNTLEFATDFQDGDGDLGLDEIDTHAPPYDSPTGGHNNLGTGHNYFIQPYKWNTTTKRFEPFFTAGGGVGELDSRYPRLEKTTDGKPAPLKGTLRYKLTISINQLTYFPGDVFRFDISIMDRAFHESNTVTTSAVTLGQ